MAKTLALINPDVLCWTRDNAGLSIDDAAKKAAVKPEKLAAWEAGDERPSIPQLRKLARVYRRPIALFYLSKPPRTFKPMHDYRRLPGVVAGHQTYALRMEMRYARDRREIALELLRDLTIEPPSFTFTASVNNDPEKTGADLRALLDVDLEDQFSWRTAYDSLNHWRAALESHGVLAFQMSRVDLDEARGFSIAERPLPVVVVNGGDSPNARVFSMLHELTHVALRSGGICDMEERVKKPSKDDRVEVFCNHVAGAVLVPREALLAERNLSGSESTAWSDDALKKLAARYGVSREVVLRRLLILRRTTEAFYRRKRAEYAEEWRRRREEQEGFAPPDVVALGRVGRLFAQLVLESYHQERITSSNVADYLDVKLRHLDSIERHAASGTAALP
jgi:Zn-dependent peptidase ImmA (M78 family)/transcriptional regulator with XRE-family HTH domain